MIASSPISLTGKCSWFGGPTDTGMEMSEGLALIQPKDLLDPYFARLFLPAHSGVGLGRSLNPNLFYCALRWDQVFGMEAGAASMIARYAMVRVTLGALHIWAQPVDYGPGDGSVIDGVKTEETGRLIDLSPGALKAIKGETDSVVHVEVFA